MKAFGILTVNEISEVSYFSEIAEQAAKLGISCYRFVPTNIHPITQIVKGSIYNNQSKQWELSQFPIPNILYDRCFYGEDNFSKQCMSIVSWLKERSDIYFLGYGLPNKLELYNVLKHTPLSPYLSITKPISHSRMLLQELNKVKKLVIKPINGSQGNGIFYIEKNSSIILVKTFNKNKHIIREFPEQRFLKWIDYLIAQKSYLVQPYLELINEKGEPFDIRILIQKDHHGQWTERGRGIRIGDPNGILSNLSAGGHVISYSDWKQRFTSKRFEFIETEIIDILSSIPKILEHAFLPLFELGIDIGIAKNGSIWILDINSKPGRKVLIETAPDKNEVLFSAPILYGKTLANSENSERKRYDAKTLSY